MSDPNQRDAQLEYHQSQVGDHWDLKRLVGEGGSGFVYKADLTPTGQRMLGLAGQQAAVKILKSTGTPDRKRFKRELQIAGTLGGQHCPKLLDH